MKRPRELMVWFGEFDKRLENKEQLNKYCSCHIRKYSYPNKRDLIAFIKRNGLNLQMKKTFTLYISNNDAVTGSSCTNSF